MLYLEDLLKMKCANPECDHTAHDSLIVLNQACHAGAGFAIQANAMEGIIHIRCNNCNSFVADIAVASRDTIEAAAVAEEAAKQLYNAMIQVLAFYMGSDKSKEKEDPMLKETMQVINRYRAHYKVDLPNGDKAKQ